MTTTDRREAIKMMIDDLHDEEQLGALETVVYGSVRTRPPRDLVIDEERYAELERRSEEVRRGGGIPHEEVLRRYGLR